MVGKNVLVKGMGTGTSLLQSIRDHLVLLLNTRQGSVPHLPDYGLPDLSIVYNSFPESIEFLRRSIEDAIKRYEPRLARVRVELKGAESMVFEATFTITAEFQEDEGVSRNLCLQTTISNTGKVDVA